MKICKYCGREANDSTANCASCGSNAFKNKCNNCGAIIESGAFCSVCGVKLGQQPKKCPNCGKEYYSNACPDCGYSALNRNTAADTVVVNVFANSTAGTSTRIAKKKRTWLWVLGWIFIFPVPLTILMLRNKTLNKWVRIGIITVGWLLYLIIGFSGEPTDSTKYNASEVPSGADNAISDSDIDTPAQTALVRITI